METKEVAQQVKLGGFVLAGLALFLAAVFLIGSENNIFSRKFTLAAMFKNVEGLKEGDNVWLSGVKIGTVSDVEVAAEGKVVVRLALKDRQSEFIRKDAIASIGSDGLVGNKIVVIRPGTSALGVEPDDTISTSSPADTQDIINIAKEVGENTRSLTEDLSLIAKRINEGKGIVGEVLHDGALAQDIRLAVESLRVTGTNTAKASSELRQLLYEMKNGNGLLPALIADTSYANTFRIALTRIQEVSTNAAHVSENLQALTEKMNDTDNTLGVLLNDKAVAQRLRSTIENADEASQKLDENMEALQHNFLFRGYFRKQEKRRAKEAASPASSRNDQ